MLKPLLRTIPTFNGNVKLACAVTDYEAVDNITYEAYVRSANLLPITTVLHQKLMPISLLQANFENDLKNFYAVYSNYFYDSYFSYITDDFQKLDKYNTNKRRNVDFEMGCKRLSYQKLKYQFAFFAPIFLENKEDLPDYFLMTVSIRNNFFTTERKIKINLANNGSDSRNYLYRYLYKYAAKLDSNFIYCLEATKQATYYGIDLCSGTLVKKIDNEINHIYKEQLTANRFDNLISCGWKRNKMCMKQVIPLSFYFNVNDFLTENERINFKDALIYVSGAYYKDGEEVGFYDFDINYTNLYAKVLRLNKQTGIMNYVETGKNILNAPEPALSEGLFYGYRNSNKINIMYNRWKLKYSNEEHPYITNMNFGFSYNQYSNYKYGEYPETFMPINGIANNRNNFLAPIGNQLTNPNAVYYNKDVLSQSYQSIMNRFATSWYHTIKGTDVFYAIRLPNASHIDDTVTYYYLDEDTVTYIPYTYTALVKELSKHRDGLWVYYKKNIFDSYYWSEVKDNKAYFGGILYDFNKIYNKLSTDAKHIDKFGVFMELDFIPIQATKLDMLKNAKYVIQSIKRHSLNKNCTLSNELDSMSSKYIFGDVKAFDAYFSIYTNETDEYTHSYELDIDKLFTKAPDGEATYIDLIDYGYFYHDLNTYFTWNDILAEYSNFEQDIYIMNAVKDDSKVEGYELLPIYYLDSLYRHQEGVEDTFVIAKDVADDNLLSNLYVSNKSNITKVQYDANTFKHLYTASDRYEHPLYIKKNFISIANLYNDVIEYNLAAYNAVADKAEIEEKEKQIKEVLDAFVKRLIRYEFYPTYSIQGTIVATNTFVRDVQWMTNYGNIIPTKLVEEDKDFIFMDQYNINNVIATVNSTEIEPYNHTAKEENKHAYYSYYRVPTDPEPEQSAYLSYITLTDTNSHEMYAKFLNAEHLHFYVSKIAKDRNGEYADDFRIEKTLFLRKRTVNYKSATIDLSVADEYIPLTDIYQQPAGMPYSKWLSDVLINLINDILYDNGLWKFSDLLIEKFADESGKVQKNKLYSIFHLTNIKNYANYDLRNIRFDFVYLKRFIMLNEELYRLANVDNLDNSKYRDLYLYYIEQHQDFPFAQAIYATKNYTYTTYATSYCIRPLFNDVKLQDKEETIIYKEYEQSKITRATYITASNLEQHYYRYKADDVHTMMDVTYYDKPYIYGKNPYNGEAYYYFKNSYVASYFSKTGFDLLDTSISCNERNKPLRGYKLLDNIHAQLDKATTYYPHKDVVSSYSYTDKSDANKHIGIHTTYSYYSLARFNKLYPEDKRAYITYSMDGDIAKVANYTSYVYYPSITYYTYAITYTPQYFDDVNLYDKFKLNTYNVSYSYTYHDVSGNVNTGYGYYTYGFYLIHASFDNTKESFNIVDTNMEGKKYFTYLNGIYVYDNKAANTDLSYTFDMFMPFSKLNVLKSMNSVDTIIKPKLYNIPISYTQQLYTYNGSTIYDIVNSNKRHNIYTVERYFDAIAPCINKGENITAYMLKYKDINEMVPVTYSNSLMYGSTINIYNYEPIKVYDEKGKFKNEFVEPEYKWFNINKYHNLEEEISIPVYASLTEAELNLAKEYQNVLTIFEDHMLSNGKNEFTHDEILFLYNRYGVKFDITPNGINAVKNEKLYKLIYKFNLL